MALNLERLREIAIHNAVNHDVLELPPREILLFIDVAEAAIALTSEVAGLEPLSAAVDALLAEAYDA